MKISIALLLTFFMQTALALKTPHNYCTYANQQYSPGSLLDMSGIKRECRTGEYEHGQLRQKAHQQKKMFTTPFMDQAYTWRKPVNIPIKIKSYTKATVIQ